MSNQYCEYIFTSEFTSKPPISRGSLSLPLLLLLPSIYISKRDRSPTRIREGRRFDFRSLSHLRLFFPFQPKNLPIYEEEEEEGGERSHRIDITARVSGYRAFIRLFIARKFR